MGLREKKIVRWFIGTGEAEIAALAPTIKHKPTYQSFG
jgi:hypothetical protein